MKTMLNQLRQTMGQENPVDALGRQVTLLTADNAGLKQQNEALGKQVTSLTIDNASLKLQLESIKSTLNEIQGGK